MEVVEAKTQTQIDIINSLLNQRKSATAFNPTGIDQSQQINGTQHANYTFDRYFTKNQTSTQKTQEIVFEITPNSNEIISFQDVTFVLIGKLAKTKSTPTFLGYKTFERERVAINGITIYDSPRDTPAVNMTQRRLQPAHPGSWKRLYLEEAYTAGADDETIMWLAMPSFNLFDNFLMTADLLPRERMTITLSFNEDVLQDIELISVDAITTGKNLFDATMAAVEQKALSPAHILQVEGYSLSKTDVAAQQTNVNIHISTTKNQHPNYILFYHAPKGDKYSCETAYFDGYTVVQNGRNKPTKNIDLDNKLNLFQLKKITTVFAPGIGFDMQFFVQKNIHLPFYVKLGETDSIAEKEVSDGGPIELQLRLRAAKACTIWVFMFYKADVIIEGPARNTYIGANNNI